MKRIVFLILTLILSGNAFSGDITICLYYGKPVESFVFSTIEGQYTLIVDGQEITKIRKGAMIHIQKNDSLFEVQDTALHYGSFRELQFRAASPEDIFQIKSVFPALSSRESEGNLAVKRFGGAIQFLNTLDIEMYIAGTIEAEGGSTAQSEYYKAQAIITRTYAIKNIYRHAHEGFNLCDGVHCQAYNGKSRMNKEIINATRFTHNMILVNESGAPVITAYHSNCGGTTAQAGQVWSHDVTHLMPVNDPFCNKSSNRNWTKEITLQKWKDYLTGKELSTEPGLLTGTNKPERHKYFNEGLSKLTMSDIRLDLNLKSAFFQVFIQDNKVVFRGHGYGHGLGLCQQGAMEMARMRYTYVDILMFYYKNTRFTIYKGAE